MKSYLISAMCLIVTVNAYAQPSQLDSMYAALPAARDTNRIILLRDIISKARNTDLASARIYTEEVSSIAFEINNPSYIAEANNAYGIYYYYIGEIDSAIIMFESAYRRYDDIDETDRLPSLLNNLGSMSTAKGDFKSSVDYHLRSLRLKEEKGDSSGMAASYYNLGNAWINLDQYEEAKENFEKAKSLSGELGDRYSVGECIEALATIEDDYERYEDGLILHKQALEIAREFEDLYQASIIIDNMGSSYNYLEKCDSALVYLEEARTMVLQMGNPQRLGYIERSMAECYGKLGNHKKSIELLNAVIAQQKEQDLLEDLSDSYNYLYTEYKREGIYQEALYALEDHMNLRDSTRGVETERLVRDLNTKYETEKKDAEIKILAKQTELDATRKNALGGGLALVTLLAGSLIYSLIQRKKKKEALLTAEKGIEIEKRKSAEQELEFKKKELTAKVLQLASKNEFLQSLEEQVGNLKSSVDTSVTQTSLKISRMIHSDSLDDKEWDQFGKEFSSIHQDFLDKLKSQYGDFSKNDLRLIALLKMNLSSKDIANTLRISPDGVKKARYRLRKKLDLESSVDIQDYLIGY